MLPIETVVELLVANYVSRGTEIYVRHIGRIGRISASNIDDLQSKVRTYLETLVPLPKLLSECEDGKPYVVSDENGWLDVLCRSGNEVTGYNTDRQVVALWGNASEFTAIQPVEVNRE